MVAVRDERPVLVTRPEGRAGELLTLLAQQGIAAQHQPLTRLVPARGDELAHALDRLAAGSYSHLVVTSRTAAQALRGVEPPPGTEVVAVGEGTAQELVSLGLPVGLVAGGSGADLVTRMPPAAPGATVLFPASSAATRTVPEGLRSLGYQVHEVTAYAPQPVEPPPAVAVGQATGAYGALVLTSAMIARRAAGLGVHASTRIVTLGAPTSAAVREAGLAVAVQAVSATDAALAQAVAHALTLPAAPAPPAAPSRSAAPAPSAATPTSLT